jgi:hypothetical protein
MSANCNNHVYSQIQQIQTNIKKKDFNTKNKLN